MNPFDDPRVRQLCEQAAKEQDANRVVELSKKICETIDEKLKKVPTGVTEKDWSRFSALHEHHT
jgi:hypothetical protein